MLLGLWISVPGFAAGPYDPAIDWQTLKTEHFLVHFSEDAQNLAVRVGRIAEEVLPQVAELTGYQPKGEIEIVLTDRSDFANGSASVLPKNVVRLFLTAPTELTGLAAYDDWLRLLVIHELAHICDLDQSYGLARFLRIVFGKIVQPNGYTPQFLSEGFATYVETLLTARGRGRSSYVEMILRMAALEGQLLDIDQANILFSDWPGPNSAYYYGGRFHLWLHKKFGIEGPKKLHQNTASMPVPYLYWPAAKVGFGRSLPELWKDWQREEYAYAKRVQAKVLTEGVTPSRRLSFHGRNIAGTRYTPDGRHIIYSRTSPVDGSTIRMMGRDGKADRHLVLLAYSPRFAFESSGRAFYFSRNAINRRFNDYNDLYRYDIDDQKMVKLKVKGPSNEDVGLDEHHALRARDPDVSPDGKRLVFVQNRLHQSWLSIGELDSQKKFLALRTLVPPFGDRQFASPRFSPDGRMVAVSVWIEDGYRDIFLIDASDGSVVQRVTADKALDNNPAFSPDGRYLLFESDRSGIFNIYAYDLAAEKYYRLTNVVGGAFQPDVSPDGQTFLFRNASGIGFDIHEADFNPARWKEVSSNKAKVAAVDFASAQPRAVMSRTLDVGMSIGPYRPSTMLAPFRHNWVLIPTAFLRGDDWTGGLTTFSTDALLEQAWSLGVQSSVNTGHLGWSAAYVNNQYLPTIAAGYIDDAERLFALDTSTDTFVQTIERRRLGAASISWPIRRRHDMGLSFAFEHRDYSALQRSVRFNRAEAFYRYAFVRRYPYSVGGEDGNTLGLNARMYHPSLGSDFTETLLTFDGRSYIPNRWWDNHVFAFRLVGAVAIGPDFLETFALGGNDAPSLLGRLASRSYALRGFGSSSDAAAVSRGTGALASYFEYRFPLWHIERGLWDLPLYFERAHGAFFIDAGNTFGDAQTTDSEAYWNAAATALRRLRAGVGFEARFDLVLGWGGLLTTRLGIGMPALNQGRPDFQSYDVYLGFGSSI